MRGDFALGDDKGALGAIPIVTLGTIRAVQMFVVWVLGPQLALQLVADKVAHRQLILAPVVLPAGDQMRQIVGGNRVALVIQAEAVVLQIIEPDIAGGAALGKDQDGGGDPGIGFEDAGGEVDHRLELVVLHQQLAQLDMGLGRAEQYALGHYGGAAAPDFEHLQGQDGAERDYLDRTQSAFIVPKSEITAQKYDLSINRYKQVLYQEEQYEAPTVILGKLKALENEILADLNELEKML